MSTHHQTISPIDGSVCAEFELAADQLIESALQRAVDAQRHWKRVPMEERAAICRRMVSLMVERANYMIDIAPELLADLDVGTGGQFRRFIRREPLGVVLVLAPWNYPYLTSVNAVIPAIMAGNSVILKMALQTAPVAERYAEAFDQAALPEGVFQYLHATH